MILSVRDKVAAQVNQDRTLEEILAAKPTAEFDTKVRGDDSAAFVTGDEFVTWLYKEVRQDTEVPSSGWALPPATGPDESSRVCAVRDCSSRLSEFDKAAGPADPNCRLHQNQLRSLD